MSLLVRTPKIQERHGIHFGIMLCYLRIVRNDRWGYNGTTEYFKSEKMIDQILRCENKSIW